MIGEVVSGKGKGKKFILMEEYKRGFKSKLGIDPYPGTLNVVVREIDSLRNIDGITIEGFEKNGKKFGGVKCFPARIGRVKCAILIPEKSREKYVEIISPYNLREKFKLRDGEHVNINFLPFVKRRRKQRMECGEGKIRIYYDSPTMRNPLFEDCNEDGRRLLPPFPVACLIFEGEERKSYEMLMKWVRRKYSIMYPPVLIDHGKLKEWQVEIKWNPA